MQIDTSIAGSTDRRLLAWERSVLRGIEIRLGRLDLDSHQLTYYEREVIAIVERRLAALSEEVATGPAAPLAVAG